MKQSRRHRGNSDISPEDRRAHKQRKRSPAHPDKKLVDEMASRHRSSKEDRHGNKHGRHARDSRDKPPADDKPRDSTRDSRSRHSHRKSDDVVPDNGDTRSRHSRRQSDSPNTDSSDEILIKHRGTSRSNRNTDKDEISRQLKNIEKAQREALRPSSSLSQEIHIHYVPVVTTSASPPLTIQQSLSSSASNSDGRGTKRSKSTTSDITKQLRHLTMSPVKGDCSKSDRSKSRSRRSKHEKRGKHGKKKVTSKFLAPLAQRWICYECGRLRSETIQHRHPLQEGQKMQPNWCGKCRVYGELHRRPLNWDGQRHYCWGCGIVRSRGYHRENPIAEGEECAPNYCKPCRELSPSFDYNLREVSEVGSAVKIRATAFNRQMAEAELSDIDEDGDEDEVPSSAPGKENQDPREKKGHRATNSFMLKNCSFKTKTTSDASSNGSIPLKIRKALQLDKERARTSRNGGVRLSASSYEPPSVESPTVEDFNHSAQYSRQHQGTDYPANEVADYKVHDTGASNFGVNGQASSPTIIVAPVQPVITTSSTKKKVHWIRDDRPGTADSTRPYSSDSGFSSGFPSDVSIKSTGSRGRVRHDPATPSTGSPPEREGATMIENIGDSILMGYKYEGPSVHPSEHGGYSLDRGIPSQGAFEDTPREAILTGSADMSAFSVTQPHTLSGYPGPISPVPLQSSEPIKPARSSFDNQVGGQNGQSSYDYAAPSPISDVPNFSRPYQSPARSPKKPYLDVADHDNGNSITSPDFGARPDYDSENQSPLFRSSSAFSDSTTRRDFSGYEAPEFGARPEYKPEHQPPFFHSSSAFSDSTTRRDFSGHEAPGFGGPGFGGPEFDVYNSPENNFGGGDNYSAPAYDDARGFAPPPSYGATFDFSQFGEAGPTADCGSGEKFVREKKFTRTTRTQTPKRPYSWRLYDDGDADEGGQRGDYEWKDGHTTVHHSGGGAAGQVLNSGNTVTILSIQEIGTDDLTEADNDNDGISDLGTVTHTSVVKTICAA